MRVALGVCVLHAIGCGSAPRPAADPAPPASEVVLAARYSFAPQPQATLSAREVAWVARCGKPDAALFVVARALASERAAGGAMPDTEQIARRLREAGAPYVWPVAVGLSGSARDRDVEERLDALRAQVDKDGEARCGFGLVETPPANGYAASRHLVAIAVANLGTFEKLPVHTEPGRALIAQAQLAQPLRSASAYLLGPSGDPKSVQVTLSPRKDALTVRFAPAGDGEYLLQMLGDLGSGPRPLFEALVVSGKGSARSERSNEPPASDDEAGVLARINALRASHGHKPLVMDPALSTLALAHAQDMAQKQKLAHDVGNGTPDARVKRAGLALRVVGENVSFAKGVIAAHEGIERSPSHRANVLRAEFTKVGIGFVRGPDGMVYLAEIFGG